MRRRTRYALIGGVGVVLTAPIAIWLIDGYEDPKRLAYMLNISATPKSLKVIDCQSGAITDVVITCAIEVDPTEFPLLLAGYHFSQQPIDGTSYTIGLPKIGREFPVAMDYNVQPAPFEHGGAVRVIVDRESRRALVDLYIE